MLAKPTKLPVIVLFSVDFLSVNPVTPSELDNFPVNDFFSVHLTLSVMSLHLWLSARRRKPLKNLFHASAELAGAPLKSIRAK
jgi:hypothetical protein